MKTCEKMENKKSLKCSFCESYGKYLCSRCRRNYCSVNCFRSVSHSQCSEQFYKECVFQELKSQRFDKSSKMKIIEILKRNANDNKTTDLIDEELKDFDINTNDDLIDEENDQNLIETRFNDLDINSTQVCDLWDKLSDSEKKEFNHLIESGKIGQLVSAWNAWWTSQHSKQLITQIDDLNHKQTNEQNSEPKIVTIPDLWPIIIKPNDLISKPLSPSICPAVINTIYCYCYVCRFFNGDYNSLESIELLIETCPQLSLNINCIDLRKSLEMCVQQIMTKQPQEFAVQLLYDLKCIIEGPKLMIENYETLDYVLRALSDSIQTIIKVKKNCSKQKRKTLKLDLIVKKLEFYMSWTVINGNTLINTLTEINGLMDSMLLFDATFQVESNERPKLHQKPLIEEIS